MKKIIPLLIVFSMLGCNSKEQPKTIGTIEKMDPAFGAIVSSTAKVEVIAEGFEWSEGPLWVEKHQMLLFSDVPTNTIYKWTEAKGKEVYLKPSGYTGTIERGGEMGSNGLILDSSGNLVLCQHGDRRMARMDAPLDKPASKFITLADKYNDKRLSSPNDAVYNSIGELFFTDPPYGLLRKSDTDTAKELPWNGVYKLKTNGGTTLLTDMLTRPNGIAFFPGENRLIVANSDPALPNWYVFDINGDSLNSSGIFHSAAAADKKWKGLPDGLKIDKNGNVFASGPGGVWFFNPEGKLLGMLRLEDACSNIALSADEKTLYITNDMQVLRFKMRD